MNELGEMYSDGKGVKADAQKAVEWYLLADKNGCPMAKHNLAERYRTGNGIPKDLKKAKALFEQSAKSGIKISEDKLKSIPFN
ncbi:MAG: sel1 repeat family protein [Candidatus Melainabacteria bacterium]|nr:MAG: sel1 repeat family protein [Candidatus Melainabacteria bacterium]